MTKKQVYLLLSLATVLLVVILYFVFNDKKDNKSGEPAPSVDENITSSTVGTSSVGTSPKKSSVPTNQPLSATQKYLDAIRVYKNVGYYFQFVDCHGAPGSLTLKKGVKFMLDNRDAVSHKLVIQGGQSFNVGAYGFAIATAPSTVGKHFITCDGGGAAEIVVQK